MINFEACKSTLESGFKNLSKTIHEKAAHISEKTIGRMECGAALLQLSSIVSDAHLANLRQDIVTTPSKLEASQKVINTNFGLFVIGSLAAGALLYINNIKKSEFSDFNEKVKIAVLREAREITGWNKTNKEIFDFIDTNAKILPLGETLKIEDLTSQLMTFKPALRDVYINAFASLYLMNINLPKKSTNNSWGQA